MVWLARREDGFIGNFDPTLVTNFDNPLSGFLVPSKVDKTGFVAIDPAVAATTKADTKHTLNGQDLNNFAPRFGFAYTPLSSNRLVIRGGYGIFFDRPSAAFINTIFSNYPFLREEEVTFPASQVPIAPPGRSRIQPSRSISTCLTASCGLPARTAPIRSATARESPGRGWYAQPDRPRNGPAIRGKHRRDF